MAGKRLRAAVRAVTADNNDAVDSVFVADICRLLLHFLFLEFRAPRGTEDRSAHLDDAGHVDRFHFFELFIQKALVTPLNSDHLALIVHSFSGNRADCRVHTGRISSAGQYADLSYFFSHSQCLRIFKVSLWFTEPILYYFIPISLSMQLFSLTRE